MNKKIGFCMEKTEKSTASEVKAADMPRTAKPSLVQVRFEHFGKPLAYYNDRFDLKAGDMVYVDGKLEGKAGVVVQVSHSFKIKLSDYHRVIALVDTEVHGDLYKAGPCLVAFSPDVIPYSKVRSWYLPPQQETDIVVGGEDGVFAPINDLGPLKIKNEIGARGVDLFETDAVRYLEVRDGRVRAIVRGSKEYEVEFEFRDDCVGNFSCDCWCVGICKHDVAAILQLDALLKVLREEFAEEIEKHGGFSAIHGADLMHFSANKAKRVRVSL